MDHPADGPRREPGKDTGEPAAGLSRDRSDSNYILSQEEFHGSLNESEIRTQSLILREAKGLQHFACWLLIIFGLYALTCGICFMPSRGTTRG